MSVVAKTRDLAHTQSELAVRLDQRTRESYRRGFGTSLDLVTSAAALRQSEITLALLQFQAAQARVDAILANADCSF